MNVVRTNVIANFIGQGANVMLMLVCIPVYVHFMGVEAYGLVGLYLTIMALVSPLDFGLPLALNRQLAILSARAGSGREMRDMVRTLQILIVGLGILVCVLIVALAPLISNYWVRTESISRETVGNTIMLMGLVIGLYWPATLYTAGMMGLQRQVVLNAVAIVMDILRYGGSIAVIWCVSASPQAFFLWQAVVNGAHSLLLGWFLWRSLPRTETPARFEWRLLAGISRFAIGLSGIAIVSLAQDNLDKVVLSKLFPLKSFGYYVLAVMATGVLFKIIGPIHEAFFPKLSEHAGYNDHTEVGITYHRACQTLSVLLLPAAAVMSVYAKDILLLWTRNPVVASNAHVVLSVLSVSAALIGLTHFPYAVQLAYGWTELPFWAAVSMTLATLPLLLALTKLWGLAGAACVPVIIRVAYVLVVVPILHRRYLKGELRKWYIEDIGRPLTASLLVVIPSRYFIYVGMEPIPLIASLAAVTIAAVVTSILAVPELRNQAKTWRMIRQLIGPARR